MGETESAQALEQGLASALARVGRPAPEGVHRLTGGATMESWRLTSGDEDLVLRRAPSLSFMEGRPFGHDSEAAIIRTAHAAGVTAPEILVELEPDDGIGSGGGTTVFRQVAWMNVEVEWMADVMFAAY